MENMRFYITDIDEYREVAYLDNAAPGLSADFCDSDEYREICVDLDGCYDYERNEWNDDKTHFCIMCALVDAFGEDVELEWEV